MTLSFGQWVKLGFGGAALLKKHAETLPLLRPLANDVFDLLESVFPPKAKPEDPVSHAEVIDKIRSGDLSDEEKAVMDRASQTFGGG